MYALTSLEATVLALTVLGTVTLLLAAVLGGVPRARSTVPTDVVCPLVHGRVQADLVQDEWTRRFVDVERCAPLGGRFVVTCSKGCLPRRRRRP